MNLDEMREIGKRAESIERLRKRLGEMRRDYQLLRHNGPKLAEDRWSGGWRVQLQIEKAESNRPGKTITVQIPYPVAEQSLLSEILKCRRRIIQLGGTP